MILVVEYAIGFGIVFVLSFLINYIIHGDFTTMLAFMLMFSGFCVWGGMLDFWVLILFFILFSVDIVYEFSMKSGGEYR